MISLAYVPLSVNYIKDVTKGNIKNDFHFRHISCFLFINVQIITPSSSTIGIKIKFASSNMVKFDSEQISKPEFR